MRVDECWHLLGHIQVLFSHRQRTQKLLQMLKYPSTNHVKSDTCTRLQPNSFKTEIFRCQVEKRDNLEIVACAKLTSPARSECLLCNKLIILSYFNNMNHVEQRNFARCTFQNARKYLIAGYGSFGVEAWLMFAPGYIFKQITLLMLDAMETSKYNFFKASYRFIRATFLESKNLS